MLQREDRKDIRMNKLGASTLAVLWITTLQPLQQTPPIRCQPWSQLWWSTTCERSSLERLFCICDRSTDLRIQLLQHSARNQGRSTSSSTQVRHSSRDPSELFHICCDKMNNFETYTRYHPTEGFAGRKEKAHSRCQCLCFAGSFFCFDVPCSGQLLARVRRSLSLCLSNRKSLG